MFLLLVISTRVTRFGNSGGRGAEGSPEQVDKHEPLRKTRRAGAAVGGHVGQQAHHEDAHEKAEVPVDHDEKTDAFIAIAIDAAIV